MKKQSYYMDKSQIEKLKILSTQKCVNVSVLVRIAVSDYLKKNS
jgi:hypothetical protein